MAGVRGRVGAALRRAGDVSAAAAGKVTARRTTKAAPASAAEKASPVKAGAAGKATKAAAGTAVTKAGAAKSVGRVPATKAAATKAAPAKGAAKTAAATKSIVQKVPATKAAVKAGAAKKAPATKGTAAKKAPATKATTKATAVKKAPATKATPAKKAATKATPAKKAATKATPAKKAPASTAPVASQGSDLSAVDLAEIRSQLQDELAEMQVEYDRSLSQLDDLRQSHDGAGDDQADTGSAAFERDQEQSIAANRQLLITQMQHAIERIDSGTYGSCEDCGKPIPRARLRALPMATLDAECKARAERH